MKKYNINIGSNSITDDKFFFGTGFMGASFQTIDELRSLLHKYATFEKDGKRYWREEIKMTFSLQSSVQAFKAEGDRQAKENGVVDLFSCMAACAKDPFRKISIIYRPSIPDCQPLCLIACVIQTSVFPECQFYRYCFTALIRLFFD